MIYKFKNLPVAATGLSLGIATLGISLSSLSDSMIPALIGMMFSVGLILVICIKNVFHLSILLREMEDYVIGSFIPTMSMAIMALSGGVLAKLVIFGYSMLPIAKIFWLLGFSTHVLILGIFIYYRIILKDYAKIHPGWFVPPIGIVVASVSGVYLGFAILPLIALYFGIFSLIIILPVMWYKILFKDILKSDIMPTFGIIGAPINLCLAGYLTIFVSNPNPLIINVLLSFAIVSTFMVYISLYHLIRFVKFSPLFASYTFPLSIGSLAILKYSNYLSDSFYLKEAEFWYKVAIFETSIASIVIFYITFMLIKKIYQTLRH